MIRVAAVLAVLAGPAQAAQFNFCWSGSNGYTMTGSIGFADALMARSIVTEEDVSLFRIAGFRDGVAIGKWNLNDLAEDTTWHLRFDPRTLTFPTGGSFPGEASQGWNANGDVTDCGLGGFGFNSGNYAQDICLDGVWIRDSSIPPETLLGATAGPVTPDCKGAPLLGKGRGAP